MTAYMIGSKNCSRVYPGRFGVLQLELHNSGLHKLNHLDRRQSSTNGKEFSLTAFGSPLDVARKKTL